VFADVASRAKPELRQVLSRAHGAELPRPGEGFADADGFRAAFLGFLRFLRSCVAGQSSLRVEAAWASQGVVLQGFAQFQGPDAVLREDRLAEGLDWLCAELGLPPQALPAPAPEGPFALGAIYGADLEAAAREAYGRDYLGFGFSDWAAAP
jgi:hypothetical protein